MVQGHNLVIINILYLQLMDKTLQLLHFTAIGGGKGGSSYFGYTPDQGYGSNGGSGGGASGYSDGNTGRNGAGTVGQGNSGGGSGGQYYSGGGGGAGLCWFWINQSG